MQVVSVRHPMLGVAGMSALPPLAAYQEWIETQPRQGLARNATTAAQFRRMAAMRRQDEGFSAIAGAVGKSATGAKVAYHRLPEALR